MAAPQTLLSGSPNISTKSQCLTPPGKDISFSNSYRTHRCTKPFKRIYDDNQRSTTIRHAGRTAITPRRRRGQHTHGTPATLRLVRRRPQTRHRRNTQGSHPHQRHLESNHRWRTHGVSRHHRVTDSVESEYFFSVIPKFGLVGTHRCTKPQKRIYDDNQRSTTIRHAGRTAITPRRRRGQHTYGTSATLRLVRRRPQTRF